MNLGLNNKIAVVTGASKGMGKSIAYSLASEGVKVLLVARNLDLLKSEVHSLLELGYSAAYLQGDVSDLDLPNLVLEFIKKEWNSSPDILINNAGGPPPGSILNHSDQIWDAAIQLNLMSVIRFTRAMLPYMKEKNGGELFLSHLLLQKNLLQPWFYRPLYVLVFQPLQKLFLLNMQ